MGPEPAEFGERRISRFHGGNRGPFPKGCPDHIKASQSDPDELRRGGSGTIVGGTTATKATEAAQTACPGGVVDRVAKLSNGEYEVKYRRQLAPPHLR